MREKGKLSGILEQRHTALRYRTHTHTHTHTDTIVVVLY